jgi:hypothetical protein
MTTFFHSVMGFACLQTRPEPLSWLGALGIAQHLARREKGTAKLSDCRSEPEESNEFDFIPMKSIMTPMKSLREQLWFEVPNRRGFVNITRTVEDLVRKSGVQEGLCLVNAMHITTCVA